MTKTRFAPSPTGFLHIGGLRTALFAYLYAKKTNGKFVLRIEDTDRERFVEGGIENIIESLTWSGIEIDEGVFVDDTSKIEQKGDNGPYIQSERLTIYKEYIDKLVDENKAYYCFCTKERLSQLRSSQEAEKKPSLYDGCCREMTKDEIEQKIAAGESYVIRLRMPKTGTTIIEDVVRGKVEFKNELIDDQVLLKADGFPTYHLAVVVDDYLMGITHVIRGEEWLPSTPKHIELYKAFGWEIPQFVHISLLVNEKRQKLSKRHGDVSVMDFKEKGYLPEALVNFVTLLGWNPGDDRELFSIEELKKVFSLENLSKPAAVFDYKKLDWMNGEYMKRMSDEELVKRTLPFFVNAGLVKNDVDKTWLSKVVALEKERVSTIEELVRAVDFIFTSELVYSDELLVWKKSDREDAKEMLKQVYKLWDSVDESQWGIESLSDMTFEWITQNDYKNGNVLWPTRVALSGQKNSPGPFEIAEVLGKEKTLTRLNKAKELLL